MPICPKCQIQVEGQFCTRCGTRVGPIVIPGNQANVPNPAAYQAQPAAPAAAPKKRGPLFWALTGCLGIVVIAAILATAGGYFFVHKMRQAGVDPELMQTNPGLAVARMMSAMNPDIEVLGVDENRGIIRVRNKKDGKTLIVNLEDAKKGKIVFMDENNQRVEIQAQGEDDKASVAINGPEGSVRVNSGGAMQLPSWLPAYPGAESGSNMNLSSNEKNAATCTFKTGDAPEDVASFYEKAFRDAQFEVERNAASGSFTLVAHDSDSKRTATVTAAQSAEGTAVILSFESKK